jgi:hypothetical protein
MTTNEDPNAGAAAAASGDGSAAGAGAAAGGESGSLFDGVQPGAGAGEGGQGAGEGQGGDDWLPEKFRVVDADGKLDEAASARKLAQSYDALESHKGSLPQVPASPDDYTLEAPKDAEGKPLEGFDVEEFTGDPLFKSFAKDAHANGLTQAQLQFVVERYLKVAPELIAADKQVSLAEAKTELGTIWKDEGAMRSGLADAMRAITTFGAEADDVPGSRARLQERFATDPDFAAFAASVAKELKEDQLPAGGPVSSDMEVESLQKSKAYWDPKDPQHAIVKQKVDTFYAKKFGNKKR